MKCTVPRFKRKVITMTVCIAAIYQDASLVGASDRMMTAGGVIEFERNQPKIWPITISITAMIADDILIHTELHKIVLKEVKDKIIREPTEWVKVQDVAEWYSQSFTILKKKTASRDVLQPLGLDFETFISRQKEMDSNFIARIEERLDNFYRRNIGGAATIIAGIDAEGPHIYTINNGQVTCEDKIGFSVIGIGYSHAASHLMFSGHTPNNLGEKTLLITHQAKKKAEVAPGVGKETDMFLIPSLGALQFVKKEWIQKLDKIWGDYLRQSQTVNDKAEKKLVNFLNKEAKRKGKELTEQQVKEIPKEIDSNK